MHIHLIDRLEALNELCALNPLLERAATLPMQQPIWTQACAATFARGSELRILVAAEGGRVVAWIPLMRSPQKNYYELPGVAHVHEPTDALCSEPRAWAPLSEALVQMGAPFLLQRLPMESPLLEHLKEAMEGRGMAIRRPELGWPVIPLGCQWSEPESQLNAGRRSDLRRARRRAEALGPVGVEVLSPGPAELGPLLEEAFAIEAASWKGGAGSALALDPVRGAFYRHYAAAASAQGILRLAFLRIGEQRVAMQLEVEYANRIWLLKTGYQEAFARCSPGLLLLSETIRDAAGRGLISFEFLGSPEEWTRVWTKVEHPCVTLHGYPFGLRGLSAFADRLVKSAWQRVNPTR